MLVVVQTAKNVDLSSWRCQMAKNLIRMVKGRERGAKSGLKGRSKMLECELWALSLRQLCSFLYREPCLWKKHTVFTRIVSSLNSFCSQVRKVFKFSLHKGKIFGVIFLTTLVQFIWIQVIFCLSLQLWIWNKSEEKCSIGQRFMCTKVTSYKIHILIIEQVQNNLSVI